MRNGEEQQKKHDKQHWKSWFKGWSWCMVMLWPAKILLPIKDYENAVEIEIASNFFLTLHSVPWKLDTSPTGGGGGEFIWWKLRRQNGLFIIHTHCCQHSCSKYGVILRRIILSKFSGPKTQGKTSMVYIYEVDVISSMRTILSNIMKRKETAAQRGIVMKLLSLPRMTSLSSYSKWETGRDFLQPQDQIRNLLPINFFLLFQ